MKAKWFFFFFGFSLFFLFFVFPQLVSEKEGSEDGRGRGGGLEGCSLLLRDREAGTWAVL